MTSIPRYKLLSCSKKSCTIVDESGTVVGYAELIRTKTKEKFWSIYDLQVETGGNFPYVESALAAAKMLALIHAQRSGVVC